MVNTDIHPKISILLPTHNRADVLCFAIESALHQTEQNFELLIVGDGCTDDTAYVVTPYLQDKRIKWFDFPKGRSFGYDNRNKVLTQATGEYISFLAHDDIISPDHLALLSNHLDHNDQIDIVYSRSLWIDDQGAIFPSITNLHDKASLDAFFDLHNTIPASCFMHRRSVFEKIGYWNENLERAADWDFWKKIIHREKSNFIFESTITVFHFKAIWKSIDQSWPADIHPLFQYLYNNGKDHLKPLFLESSNGIPFQECLMKNIKAEPGFIDSVRRSAMALLDHMLYHRFSTLLLETKPLPRDQTIQPNSLNQENSLLYKIKKIFS